MQRSSPAEGTVIGAQRLFRPIAHLQLSVFVSKHWLPLACAQSLASPGIPQASHPLRSLRSLRTLAPMQQRVDGIHGCSMHAGCKVPRSPSSSLATTWPLALAGAAPGLNLETQRCPCRSRNVSRFDPTARLLLGRAISVAVVTCGACAVDGAPPVLVLRESQPHI